MLENQVKSACSKPHGGLSGSGVFKARDPPVSESEFEG